MQREAAPWGSIRSKAKEGGLEETPGVQMLFARKLLSILGKRGLEVAVSGSDAGGRVGLDGSSENRAEQAESTSWLGGEEGWKCLVASRAAVCQSSLTSDE